MNQCYKFDRQCTSECVAYRKAFDASEIQAAADNARKKKEDILPTDAFGKELLLSDPANKFSLGDTRCMDLYLRNQEIIIAFKALSK